MKILKLTVRYYRQKKFIEGIVLRKGRKNKTQKLQRKDFK